MELQSALPEGAMVDQDIYKAIGKQLKHFRRSKRLTQAEVAKFIEISPQQYQKYEDAQSKCNLNYLTKLAELFGTSITVLIGDESHKTSVVEEQTLSDSDVLARMISAFVQLKTYDQKMRLVQLVETITDPK